MSNTDAPIEEPSHSSDNNSFPVAGLVGVFVAVVILALAFVACGVTRRRQQRRRAQMAFNHEQFYATHHQPQQFPPPHLNKPLPGAANTNNNNNLGTTTQVYGNYSSGGGPPVFTKDLEIGAPPPAYSAKSYSKSNQNAAVVSSIQ